MNRPAKFSVKFLGREILTEYPLERSAYVVENYSDLYTNRKLFNYSFTNFSDVFSYSRDNIVSPSHRIKKADNLIIPEENSNIRTSFEIIKEISNTERQLNKHDALRFLDSYKQIFRKLDKDVSWSEADFFIVPLKGGGVITELFNDINQEQILKIDSKRVPLVENGRSTYGFGMHIPTQIHTQSVTEADKFVEGFSNKKVTILELCVASGITTMGFLLDFYNRNIFPREITVLSTAIAQQGFEISSNFAKELGIDLKFISARMVYSLTDHYKLGYDPLMYEDGKLVLKSPYDAFKLIYNTRKKGYK